MATTTPRGAPTSLTQWNAVQQETAEQVDVPRLVSSIQNSLRQRGLVAWVSLGQGLEKAQADANGQGFGRATLKRVLNENQINVTEVDTRALLRYLGDQDDSRTTAEAVKNLICGPLTDRRLDLVQSVFEQLDRKRVGYVATPDVVAFHDASKHPSVMFGEKTPAQVHDEFLTSFQLLTRSTTSGSAFVNQYQWMSYFQYVSGHVPSEEYFDLVLKRVWKATPRTSLSEATSSRSSGGIVGIHNAAAGVAAVVPMSLLQALNDPKHLGLTISTTASLPSPAPVSSASTMSPNNVPQRLHRSNSLNTTEGASPKATHTNAEFLKGSQIAACMVDPSLRQPTPSPRGNSRTSPRATAAPVVRGIESLDPGTLSVLTRLRGAIKARGLRSLVELTRQVRLSDADSDGLLSLAEFKQAIKQTEEATLLQLSESDLRVLFKYLDRDHRGAIPVSVALDFIREPLNPRRLELVQFAYDMLLDFAGGHALDPSDVVQRYDAARHPDVIAGRKTEESVFQEFIENFDLEDSTDGKISRLQWENYYHNVSFFVGDDEYFELMVRNTWQLTQVPTRMSASGGSGGNAASVPSGPIDKRVFRGFTTGHNSRQTFAILQPDLGDHHASIMACEKHGIAHPSSPTFQAQHYGTANQSKDLRRVIHQLRAAVKDQGIVGFISMQRKFRMMDDDQNGSLSLDEFMRAMRESKVLTLSTHDVQNLFHFFDVNHDGAIDFNEFLMGIREPMNERRMLFVRMAFDLLDKDRNGVIEMSDIVDVYDARRHPDVISGRKTDQDVFTEFLESFDVDQLHDGKISFDEWTRYYQNISACIDDDDYFELMMRNAWHISGGQGWCANSSNRRLLVTHADGSQSVEEVQNDLGVKREDAARVLAAQLAAGRGTGALPFQKTSFYDVLDHSPRPTTQSGGGIGMVRTKNNSSDSIAACLGSDAKPVEQKTLPPTLQISTQPGQRRRGSLPPPLAGATPNPVPQAAFPAGVQAIIAKLKVSLKAKGAFGFCGLSRKFRIMDDDGNGSVNVVEFRKAIRECDLELSDGDLRLLFQYFDRDHSGGIDLTEFLAGVRDPMNEHRLGFVREALKRLDKDGNGLLEPSDVVETYDASKHPDVLSGRKTQEDVFRQFLENFDVDGIHDGKITWDQWVQYYHNISASIDDDDYFELMMRNAWHISGGVGWCENTTNRRVLVTQEDGRELVREVKDDLGVKVQEIQARLQAQDKAQSGEQRISTFASMDLTQPPNPARKIVSLKDASFGAPLKASAPVSSSQQNNPQSLPGDAVYFALRRRLEQKTLSDVVALRKRVMHYIDAKTGTVSAAHCAQALSATLGLTLTDGHCEALFEFFNQQPQLDDGSSHDQGTSGGYGASIGARLLQTQNQSNRISVKKLLAGVLGRLSDRNLDTARRVFGSLQAAGKGRVFPAALARSFQAAQHPDVKLGLVSADAVFQDFAASFELSGSADGTVTLDHFEVFCLNWRATLSSDEHLEVLLRECFVVGD